MAMRSLIRDIELQSVDLIHDLNECALPHVNSVPRSYFREQIGTDAYFRAVHVNNEPVAFVLAMTEAADYDSLNFLWFRERFARFVYIDRVVVGVSHRRAGLGELLYTDLLEWARRRAPRVTCEVNLRPSNEPSFLFHVRQGFGSVGTQETEGGRKTVSLLVREFAEQELAR